MDSIEDILLGRRRRLRVEKSGFFKSGNAAIIALSPRQLFIEGSNFEDCGESGVEVRLVRPNEGSSGGLLATCATGDDQVHELTLKFNSIVGSNGSGVLVCGDKSLSRQFLVNFTFSDNTIARCHNDGVTVKQIRASKLELFHNRISECKGHGVTISAVQGEAVLTHNVLRCNEGCGLYFLQTSATVRECECNGNLKSGMSFVGRLPTVGTADQERLHLMASDCHFEDNQHHGLALLEPSGGLLRVEGCTISSNRNFGLFLSDHD